MNTKLSVSIFAGGSTIKLELNSTEYERLLKSLREKKEEWLSIKDTHDNETILHRPQVAAVRSQPVNVRVVGDKLPGVTLKEICSIAPQHKYRTLGWKLRNNKLELDRGSERRVLLTEKNFSALRLNVEQVKQLQMTEQKRTKR
jgi:hypothetical protein